MAGGFGGRFRRSARTLAEESGAGTVFSLSLLMVAALLGGLAIDVNNAWRYNELLSATADVAAHAGAVVLAQGGNEAEAREAAIDAIALNMPEQVYGKVLAEPAMDVQAVHFDPALNALTPDGDANAVLVRVQRSRATQNQVPTLLLRLAGRAGWDMAGESVAALVPTRRCRGTDGLFARGVLRPGPGAHVGADYCLHSQDKVVPDQGSWFDEKAGLSMPDLADCGLNCTESVSDGAEVAAFEANLVREDLTEKIDGIREQFLNPRMKGPVEAAFFASRPLDSDLSALDELGVDTSKLATGQVIEITLQGFSRLRALPGGLIYKVTCSSAAARAQAGLSPEVLTLSAGQSQMVLRNLALVTNCALHIDPTARIEGALILSTREEQGFAVTAEFGAVIGGTGPGCGASQRATIMALGSVLLTSGVLGQDVGIVSAGDITLGLPPGGLAPVFALTGVGMHAGGAIDIEASHAYSACGTGEDPFTPQLMVIRQVAPTGQGAQG